MEIKQYKLCFAQILKTVIKFIMVHLLGRKKISKFMGRWVHIQFWRFI